MVGSYFGSRMKSFNPKISNRQERHTFIKAKIPVLYSSSPSGWKILLPLPRNSITAGGSLLLAHRQLPITSPQSPPLRL